MSKSRQRIVSIIIGLILAVLLMIIAVRVIQRRGSQASQPETFTTTRLDEDSCRVTAVTKTDEPILLKYGTVTPTFFFRFEPAHITPQGDGKYQQEAQIDNLSKEKVSFVVENFENIASSCDPFTGGAGAVDTSANQDILPTALPTQNVPTSAPTAEPLPTSSDTQQDATGEEKDVLPLETAKAFFSDNPDVFIGECVQEFKDEYVGLAQVCGTAYLQK